jgi:hypothetical protein
MSFVKDNNFCLKTRVWIPTYEARTLRLGVSGTHTTHILMITLNYVMFFKLLSVSTCQYTCRVRCLCFILQQKIGLLGLNCRYDSTYKHRYNTNFHSVCMWCGGYTLWSSISKTWIEWSGHLYCVSHKALHMMCIKLWLQSHAWWRMSQTFCHMYHVRVPIVT